MKDLILIATIFMTSATGLTIDFGKDKTGASWRIVNDGVMGGLSTSEINLKDDSLLFTGNVSLENNGGFASVRTLIDEGALNNCKIMIIRYKSDNTNRNFGLSLKSSQQYYIPYYKHIFSPKTKDWETIEVPLSEFKHYKISEIIGNNMPAEDLKDVFNIALIISDKKEGEFNIEIDYIKFI